MWIYTKNDTLINTDNVKKFYINHEFFKITYKGHIVNEFFGLYADVLEGHSENITIFATENEATQELERIFNAIALNSPCYKANGVRIGS